MGRMLELVPQIMGIYRRHGGDPSFAELREALDAVALTAPDALVDADAEVRRMLGLPCHAARWLKSLPRGEHRAAVLEAAVAAALLEAPTQAAFDEEARSIAQMGEEFATAVARVRLAAELVRAADDSRRGTGASGEAAGAAEFPQPGAGFGPPFATGPHRFTLHRVLGAGATSTVYDATDLRYSEQGFEHRVVLKVLRPRDAEGAVTEVIRGRRVSHPNVLRWFEAGVSPCGFGYVVSERCDGRPLTDEQLLARLGLRGCIRVVRQVAEAVHAAHQAGVLHLDLKPANVLVEQAGVARLCDFGSSQPADTGRAAVSTTPIFAAPEVLAGAPPGIAADVYALGAILRWCVDALPEEAAGGAAEEARDASRDAPQAARLEAIWRKAMAPDPSLRYQSAGDLAADLAAWLDLRPLSIEPPSLLHSLRLSIQREPLRWGAASALVALLLVTAAAAVWQRLARAEADAERARMALNSARSKGAMTAMVDRVADVARDSGRTAFPQLVALHWLASARGADSAELLARAEEAQADAWRTYLRQQDARGARDHMETRLAETCLVMTELAAGRWQTGQQRLPELIAWWHAVLPPGDDWLAVVDGLETLTEHRRWESATAGGQNAAPAERAEWEDRLVRLRAAMTDVAPRVGRLADNALTRLRGAAAAGTAAPKPRASADAGPPARAEGAE